MRPVLVLVKCSTILTFLAMGALSAAAAAPVKLQPKRGQADREFAEPPRLPGGLKISGHFSFEFDPTRGVMRFTGPLRVSQGGNSMETEDPKAWVEVDPKGHLRTSKSKWEVKFKGEAAIRPDREKP
jgi:hypothetical protein